MEFEEQQQLDPYRIRLESPKNVQRPGWSIECIRPRVIKLKCNYFLKEADINELRIALERELKNSYLMPESEHKNDDSKFDHLKLPSVYSAKKKKAEVRKKRSFVMQEAISRILEFLENNHPQGVSANQIVIGTNIARPTVEKVLEELSQTGQVTMIQLQKSRGRYGGKKFSLNSEWDCKFRRPKKIE